MVEGVINCPLYDLPSTTGEVFCYRGLFLLFLFKIFMKNLSREGHLLKIAVVGLRDSLEQAKLVIDEVKVDMIPVIYHDHNEVVPLIEKTIGQVDGYLFTGKVPYLIAQEKIEFNVPVKYVEHDNTTLYRILFHVRYHQNLNMSRFSIDLFNLEEVKEIFDELRLPFKDIYVQPFDPQKLDETTRFHIELYEQGKIDYCITPLLNTFQQLQRKRIPVFRIVPSKFAVRKALELLMLEIENLQTEEAQISVGIFNVDNFKHVTNEYPEFELQLMKLKLYELILSYGQETNSSVVFTGGDEFFIYSTRGEISKGITGKSLTELYEKIRNQIPFTVSCGIGEGDNAVEATNNARIALRYAKQNGGNSVYLRQKSGMLHGPLPLERYPNLFLVNDEHSKKISEELGMSISTISKIKSIQKKYLNKALSSNEFANAYGCSLRSARRILATLEKHGYATIEKKDQIFEKGRKRRYYRLKL